MREVYCALRGTVGLDMRLPRPHTRCSACLRIDHADRLGADGCSVHKRRERPKKDTYSANGRLLTFDCSIIVQRRIPETHIGNESSWTLLLTPEIGS